MACTRSNYCRTNPDPLGAVKCAGGDAAPIRPISQADLISYPQRVGATGTDQICSVQGGLLAGRAYYFKNTPGDCPVPTKLNLGPSAQIGKGIGLSLTGLGAASSVGLLATGGAGLGASAGGSGVALGGLPSLFGAIAGPVALAAIPIAVWAAISAHHKIAVAKEQATLCDVTSAFNQWEVTMEYYIASGQIAVADAKAAVPIMEQNILQALQAIVKGGCNAACEYQKSIRAINLYDVEKYYDSLSPRAVVQPNPANPAAPVLGRKSPLTTYGLAAVGALGVVKVAGAVV